MTHSNRRTRSHQSSALDASLSPAPSARQAVPSHASPGPPDSETKNIGARHLLVGFTVLLVAALALSVVAAGHGVLSADLSIARRIQAVDNPIVDTLVMAGGVLGSTVFLLGLAGLVLLFSVARRHWADAALVLAAAVAQFLGLLLKAVADSPRPTPDLIRITAESDGAGFPSRTTMAALLAYGTMLYLATRPGRATRSAVRWPIVAVFVLPILLVGYERVAVGAHWPSDVLGGYLWGGAVLLLLIAAHRRVSAAG